MDKTKTSPFGNNRPFSQKYSDMQRFFIVTIAGIFFAEVVAMIVIYYLNPGAYWLETLLDASIMTVLIYPIVYYFSFRPLIRHSAERERSEALLAKVLENLPVGVWIVDAHGQITHGNPASQKIWAGAKYVGPEQYGEYKAWWLGSGKPIKPEEWAANRAVQYAESSLNEEIEIECFDGTHKMILNSAVPIIEQGVVQGAIIVNEDITERKQYEQELMQSKELIESAFNSVDTLIAHMDRDFNFIRVNETYARAGGHPAEFFVGKNHFDLYPHAENQAIFQRVVDTGEPVSIVEKPFEYPEFPERGVTYWNWSVQPVKDSSGAVQGLVLSLLDVTERKRAQLLVEQRSQELIKINQELIAEIEERKRIASQLAIQTQAVEAERQRFNDVLEILPAYLILLTPDYRVAFANRYFRERFGEDQGRRCYEYLFGRSEPCENCQTYSVLKSRTSHNWEWTGPDGRIYDVYDFPFKDVDSSTLILEMGIDITTRKHAEEKLRSLNAYNRSLIEANLDALVTITPDGKIGDVNAVSEAITGFTRGELIGTDFHSYFTDPVKARAGYQQVFETGSVRNYELEIQHKDGHITPVVYNASIYRDVAGQVIGVFAAARDITERKQAEQMLERQNQELLALSTAERNARQIAETLSAISLSLTQTLEFEAILKALLAHLRRLIPFDRAYIAVTESESHWTVRAIHDSESNSEASSELYTSIDEWDFALLHKVIATQRSLLIPDIQQVTDLPDFPPLQAFRNWLTVPMLASGKVIGILAMAKAAPDFFNEEHLRLAEVVVGQASIAIQNAWLFEQVRAGHERLQSLSRRLVEVQENERRYVARELHDETGQALTALKFGLRSLEQEAHCPENVLAQVTELQRISDAIMENLHRLSMDLRPASLDHLGLVAALEQLARDVTKRYDLTVRFKAVGYSETERLPDHVEITLYRIVQEALTNAIRHACANNVDVILELRDGKAVAIVEDDGIGMDISQIDKSGHLGLLGMQERAQMVGGSLDIESQSGNGTTIAVEVPFANTNLDRG
jgi:PAS domain S-box-containing protein